MILDSSLKLKINSVKIISFDIFDTLLLRSFLEPKDVFLALEKTENCPEFFKYRSEAEPKAWEKLVSSTKDDVTLDEIYAQMPSHMQHMKEKEIAFESEHLFLNPEMYDVFEYALSQGKQVIICSDMYLPSESLKHLLAKRLNSNQFKLYVSADYGKRKHTGRLFEHVISDLQVKPSDILHIGDNMQSDVIIPKSKGINAIHYQKPSDVLLKDHHIKSFLDQNNTLESRTFLACMNILYQHAIPQIEDDYWKRFAFLYGGPLVYTYTQFINKQVQSDNITDICFVARDGYILKQIFDLINDNENIKSHYMYAPRFTNTLSYLDLGTNERVFERQNVLVNFLKSQGVNIHSINELDKYQKELRYFSDLERQEYEKYITSLNLGEKPCIVDSISASFSAQKLLSKALNMPNLIGYYWKTLECTPEKEVIRKSYHTHNVYMATYHIHELFMSAPERPIHRILNNKPVYKKDISKYEQIKIDLYPKLEKSMMFFATLVHQLKLDFKPDCQIIFDWMNSFIANADAIDFKHFKKIKNGADQSHTRYEDVLPAKSKKAPFFKKVLSNKFIYQKRINSKGVLKVKIFKIPVYIKQPNKGKKK